MRGLVVSLVLFLCVVPTFATKSISIDQLEQVVRVQKAHSDAELAAQIANLQLAERLSPARFSMLEKLLPGEKSEKALRAIADESAFLNPPDSEIPLNPTPDVAEQRRIMGLVVAYVTKAIPQLPNFIATRVTDSFEDMPQIPRENLPSSLYEPIHFVGRSEATVIYRDNREVQDTAAGGKKQSSIGPERGLSSRGEFGSILGTILLDAAQNQLGWLRWEKAELGTLAVFSYAVPKEKSHFEISYCCTADSQGSDRVFQEVTGYKGRMAVDLAKGTIMRLEVVADLKSGSPVANAGIAVEYGPVEIAGRSYFCPVHSIALSRALGVSRERQEMVQTTPHGAMGSGLAPVVVGTTPEMRQQTLLNDTTFTQYHVFRSEARVIAGTPADLPALGEPPSQSVVGETHNAASRTMPADTSAPPSSQAEIPLMPAVSASMATAAVAPTPAKPEESAIPEISIVPATSPPDIPAVLPTSATETGFHLRITSRLVDVTVVAIDKKGHPIVDLKRDDLELYDNGRQQQIRYFSQPSAEHNESSTVLSKSVGADADQVSFTNSPVITGTASRTEPEAQPHSTVFLIDAANIDFGDLTYARGEMLRFLKTVATDEPVGFYVLKRFGVELLAEPTIEHAELVALLTKWMPSSWDLARAQQEELRNRQQMEYVHSVGDLFYVNGNNPGGISEANTAVDPKLRTLGDKPSREVLAVLPALAQHLAMRTGHKSLIWVSSDNALADWSDKGPSNERGDQHLDPVALSAREALNEAHISIYPLDVSQLEAGGVSANLQSANVRLSPTVDPLIQAAQLPTKSLQDEALKNAAAAQRNTTPGRASAQMQQDTHPIQPVFRELAQATGGRAFRRAGDIAGELDHIVSDGRASYLLSFTPDTPADDTYHFIAVKAINRPDITLRYRTGYSYAKEPVSIKARFQQAVWQPLDSREIALKASPIEDAQKPMLQLSIAATDLAFTQQNNVWTDKLDVFLIARDDSALRAKLSGRTVAMQLRQATYQRILKEGLNVEERIPVVPEIGALRVVVVDENSGRMGTLTVPLSAIPRKK